MAQKDKIVNSFHLLKFKRQKREMENKNLQWAGLLCFRERTSCFSLKYRAIRQSPVFGTRRKAALRGEGFAWVPDLRSLDKLREVGVSPYLGFIPF